MTEVGVVSEEGEELNQESQEELSQEELKQLVNKTLQQGNFEAQFILTLNEWSRPGNSFTDYGYIRILYGEIEKILMDEIYDYPTTNEHVYAILPKSKTVVILLQWGNDYQGKLQEYKTLYVFTYSRGWKSLDLD